MSAVTFNINLDWNLRRSRLVVTTTNTFYGEEMTESSNNLHNSIAALNDHKGVGAGYYQLGGPGILMFTSRILGADGYTQRHEIVVQGDENDLLEWIMAQLPVIAPPMPDENLEPVAPEDKKSKK